MFKNFTANEAGKAVATSSSDS